MFQLSKLTLPTRLSALPMTPKLGFLSAGLPGRLWDRRSAPTLPLLSPPQDTERVQDQRYISEQKPWLWVSILLLALSRLNNAYTYQTLPLHSLDITLTPLVLSSKNWLFAILRVYSVKLWKPTVFPMPWNTWKSKQIVTEMGFKHYPHSVDTSVKS